MKKNRNKKIFKVITIIVVSFLALITIFDFWWSIPVSFLNRVDAQDIAYIEVRDGNNGKSFVVEDADDIAYIVDNIKGRHLYRDGISLGYMGTWFTLRFYNTKQKCVEKLVINFYNTIRKDPFFYRDPDEGLCIDYLCDLEVELVGGWDS